MASHQTAAVAAVLSIFVISTTSYGDDWPYYRGPNRNGIIAGIKLKPLDKPEQIWKANVGAGHCSVAIEPGKRYAHGREGHTRNLRCLDALEHGDFVALP